MDKKLIAQKLRTLRGHTTREELAAALGISVRAVIAYENGERIPRDELKLAFAEYFGVGVEDIFFDPAYTKCVETNHERK